MTAGRTGLKALTAAMQRWIAHLIGVEVAIEPLKELRDVPVNWYIGLDADGTSIDDMQWNGEEIDEATMTRLGGLFELSFRDPEQMLEKVRGEPVYVILAATPEKLMRMKPQNLVTGLPIRYLEAVS